ncbi:MAG: HEAT repeat domain-containing protein [Sedimentisphaerales bacterium]|nr:HEAT repeat domain-containing protein [Sedimentisphaerales bacterium]
MIRYYSSSGHRPYVYGSVHLGYHRYYRPVIRLYGLVSYPSYYYAYPYYYSYPPTIRVYSYTTPAPVIIQESAAPAAPAVVNETPVYQTEQEKWIDKLMRDTEEERELAARELAQYHNTSAVAALIDALINDSGDPVRAAAAQSLGQIAEPMAYEALLRSAAIEQADEVRLAAETAANQIKALAGDKEIYVSPKMPPMNDGNEELGLYLEDLRYGDSKVRQEAADKLEDFKGTQPAAALLNALVNDVDAKVREEAAESLAKIGDRMALPFLKWSQYNDPNDDVRKDAEKAVEKIFRTIQ